MQRIRGYVEKYCEKSGTSVHPDPDVTEAVVLGLAAHIDELGRPLCPCNFYPDKAAELAASRRWGVPATRRSSTSIATVCSS